MTDSEVSEFIDKEVKSLWTEWKPTDAGLEAWIRNLRPFDYKTAKKAVQVISDNHSYLPATIKVSGQ